MRTHDSYQYHRYRLGFPHPFAVAISKGGLVVWRQTARGAREGHRGIRYLPAGYAHDIAARTMGSADVRTRAKMRHGLPITDYELDAYLGFLHDKYNAGRGAAFLRHMVDTLNRRLPGHQQVFNNGGTMCRVSSFVRTVSGLLVEAPRTAQSRFFPGGYTTGAAAYFLVTVYRRRLKIQVCSLTREEVTVAGLIPLREALRGKELSEEALGTAFNTLRIGTRNYDLSHLYVDPGALERSPGMFDAERVTLTRRVSRQPYHNSGMGRMSPPEGVKESYGFEWEVVAQTVAGFIRKIDTPALRAGVLLGYESDSSLHSDCGVEVVSSPQSLEAHLNMLSKLPADTHLHIKPNRTEHRGGIHIHVGRTAFKTTTAENVFSLLFCSVGNWDTTRLVHWEHAARRPLNEYVRAATPACGLNTGGSGFFLPLPHSDRYRAANVRASTVEVRIFRSSADHREVARALRVVATAVAYANAIVEERPDLFVSDSIYGQLPHGDAFDVATFYEWALRNARNTGTPERYMTEAELLAWALPEAEQTPQPASEEVAQPAFTIFEIDDQSRTSQVSGAEA